MPKAKKDLDRKDAWKRDNTRCVQLRFANSSGIPQALDIMTEQTGMSASQYMRNALLDKLESDGFIELEIVEVKRAKSPK